MNENHAFISDSRFRVGEVDFRYNYRRGDRALEPEGFLPVAKDRDQLERYLRFCRELQPCVLAAI